MSYLYDFIFLVYAAVYVPYLLLTRRWYKGYAVRFGWFSALLQKNLKGKNSIWLHAVSVGEVSVINGLIGPLKQKYPQYQVVVTVTTKTGHGLALQRLGDQAIVLPSPLDFSWVAGRFIHLINPQLYIAVETEIWPNLYAQLHRRQIPIAIVNGRISDTSFSRYRAIRGWLKPVLNHVSVFCMQSHTDAQRIMALGAEPWRVKVSGNLKFDGPAAAASTDMPLPAGYLWWVAGSTHSGEEEIVMDVYAELLRTQPQWRLVLAPRHVERASEILGMVKRKGHDAVKFSQLRTEAYGGKAVIIVDTIGHLCSLYAGAALVFVGKSLCGGGGQNIIEPAQYAKAIVVGPHMANFRDIVSCFKQGHAVVQVPEVADFGPAILNLAADELERRRLGQSAQGVIAANQGAVGRTLGYLEECFQ